MAKQTKKTLATQQVHQVWLAVGNNTKVWPKERRCGDDYEMRLIKNTVGAMLRRGVAEGRCDAGEQVSGAPGVRRGHNFEGSRPTL